MSNAGPEESHITVAVARAVRVAREAVERIRLQ